MISIDETWYHRPAGVPEHVAAGGVIVRREEGRLYVALVREGLLTKYILPKGHAERGEELEATARREIAEESGLGNLTLLGKLGVRERLDFRKTAWKTTHYFLFITEQVDGTPTDKSHPYQVSWFPIDSLPELLWPEQWDLITSNLALIGELVSASVGRK